MRRVRRGVPVAFLACVAVLAGCGEPQEVVTVNNRITVTTTTTEVVRVGPDRIDNKPSELAVRLDVEREVQALLDLVDTARADRLAGLEYAAGVFEDAVKYAAAVGTRETVPGNTAELGAHEQPAGTGQPAAAAPTGLEPCGGDLPPCWVKDNESGGSYTAYNPTGCGGRSCGGAWQFDPRTWNGYGGYAQAQDAPPEVQDAKARETWDNGAGCSHWDAC